MFSKIFRANFVTALVLMVGGIAIAQNASTLADNYVISAKAGGVNFIEGAVAKMPPGSAGRRIGRGEIVEVGDRISTAVDGRAEILLNPGSFMRIGGNTAFEFKSTDLENVVIMLDRGSAMFELLATRDFRATIITPKGRVVLIDSGIYRFNVAENGDAEVLVWDGLAEVGRSRIQVKKNRGVTIGATISEIEKFDKDDERDELAVWSKERGKLIARSTAKLKDRALRDSLVNAFNGGHWGMRDAFGLWVFDRRLGYSCFLPFGAGWYSPYGYMFGHSIWWYQLPTIIYYQPIPQDPYGTKRRPNSSAVNEPMSGGGGAPPYVKLDQSIRQSQPIRSPYDPTTDRGGAVYSSPAPVFVPAPAPSSDTGAKTRP